MLVLENRLVSAPSVVEIRGVSCCIVAIYRVLVLRQTLMDPLVLRLDLKPSRKANRSPLDYKKLRLEMYLQKSTS
jgi:hypothetical protein